MIAAFWIVVLGMAIVFAVLGVLLFVMILLEKLTKPKEEKQE